MKVNFLKFFSVMFLVAPGLSYAKKYSGVVQDADGRGLPQAELWSVQDASKGCVSGLDGSFDCSDEELPGGVVIVKYVGFKDKEIDLNKFGGKPIVLEEQSYELVEVGVVADDPKKKCENKDNNGKWDNSKNTCNCPDGARWNKRTEKCEVDIANLSSIGIWGGDALPNQLETGKTEDFNVSMCKGQGGEWVKVKRRETCKCPDGKAWEASMQRCEDADLFDMRNACFALKGATTWDEDNRVCICVDENKQYDYNARRKKGKCVDIKKDEPVKQTTKPKERTEEEKAAALAETKTAYNDARDNEQSTANKALTSVTTLATGLGAMQAAQGWAEQKADKNADADMSAYLETFRCTYGNGKSVNWGPNEIELPGGNDETIAKYRNEYMTLVASLKERKESLNMKPGIESEVIFDKAEMGLYDDENVGITGGAYSSLYRAKALGSEKDQTKISEEQSKSANRLKYGAIAAGAGVAVGLIGNSAINGKIGEKIKEIKKNINHRRNEESALKDLKQCLKEAGATNVDKLKFNKFTPSLLNLDNIDCAKDLTNIRGKDATTLFTDSDDPETITGTMVNSLGEENAAAMLGEDVVMYPGQSFEIRADQIQITPKGKKAVKIDRFESDTKFGDGKGYCYNFIDVFVRGSIDGDDCDKLQPGDWMTKFESGNISGVSVCSSVRPDGMEHSSVPDSDIQSQIQKSYDDWGKGGRGRPEANAKTACYCKMNGANTKWVFDSYFTGFSCRSGCAYFCAYLVKEQDYFRNAVLGNK